MLEKYNERVKELQLSRRLCWLDHKLYLSQYHNKETWKQNVRVGVGLTDPKLVFTEITDKHTIFGQNLYSVAHDLDGTLHDLGIINFNPNEVDTQPRFTHGGKVPEL